MPGCVPPAWPWPGERVMLAGGSVVRSSEGGVGGRAVARGEGLVAWERAEKR